jgi:hypothetical protein
MSRGREDNAIYFAAGGMSYNVAVTRRHYPASDPISIAGTINSGKCSKEMSWQYA